MPFLAEFMPIYTIYTNREFDHTPFVKNIISMHFAVQILLLHLRLTILKAYDSSISMKIIVLLKIMRLFGSCKSLINF